MFLLQVLRLKPQVEWCRLEDHKEPITCADFGTNSKYLLLATGSKDRMVRLWDAGSFTGHVAAKTEVGFFVHKKVYNAKDMLKGVKYKVPSLKGDFQSKLQNFALPYSSNSH